LNTQKIKINQNVIAEILNGKVPLSEKFVRIFSAEFNVNSDYILSGSGCPELKPTPN
jgi:hypothetical protein